ncbi:MAG: carboxy terminal-processing peptidase [Sphingobacteriaceae bacterium]|nr:carboxy terminal-processing peptidase [Sphingobacteriaceae bacterium]
MIKFLKKIKYKSFLVLLTLSISSFTVLRYALDKNDIIFSVLLDALETHHYSSISIDDAFSEKVYDLYMKSLDREKKFLLKSDVDNLNKFKKEIDDQINNQRQDFFKLSVELIEKRIKEKEKWAEEILSAPMDLNVDEEYETDYKKLEFSATEADLKNEWRKMLKYQIIARMDDMLEKQEKAIEKKDTAYKVRTIDSIEVDARRKTKKWSQDYFKFYSKISSKDRFAQYANALTGVYDPHTEYFAPREKKKFDQMMSGQFEGIGARLQSKDGALRVSEIIVGSPSFKQGELKAGDDIIKVAQGAGEPVDVTTMDMDDAIELIKGKKGTEVRLTVRKSDNSIKVIPIVRDVVAIEETFAKSAILENKNKYGYIYLPSFYTDFTRNGARHCARDVKDEIEKLKANNIKGLILDLRDNGGGSLSEVIDMAGLFFSLGPVVQAKSKNNMVTIYPDRNPDITWEGPLAIMINHGSASASEILAAAIQDYKRGVIIGTPSFGKGTVQSFWDLDNALFSQFDTIKPAGQVKITHQKFYRINGGTTQLKGVEPDVHLPDPYSLIDVGERQLDNPMPWDEINKAVYSEFNTLNYPLLVKNSASRIKKSSQFALLEQQSKEIKLKKDDSKYSLNINKFRQEQKQYRAQAKKYEDLRKEIKGFNATLTQVDKDKWAVDTTRLGRENRWAINLSKDIYVHESTNVLNDIK